MSDSHSGQHASCRVITSLVLGAVLACARSLPAADTPDEFFEKRVRPILGQHCLKCHSGTKTRGGLSLDHREGWQRGGESGPAIIPGKPQDSLLIDAINYRSLEMPPPDIGRLSDQDIATLTQWVELGAPDPREGVEQLGGMSVEDARNWWAFQPLPTSDTPLTPADIDGLLVREMDSHSVPPTLPADCRTLLRRAAYDLTGLPPSSSAVDECIGHGAKEAFAKEVDRLLASPQYGEKWGRHWLDVVRYADTAGENTDRPLPHAWRYRNWVIDAFNADMPYDEFVRLQLAGDLLTSDADHDARQAGIIATGYLAIARRFGHDIDKDIHLTHEDVIDNLGKNFLGLTLGCARCHEHKYDPVTSEDYYALYGIFQSTRFAFPGCEPKGQPRDLVPLIPQTQADQLMAEYQQKLQKYQAAVNQPMEAGRRVKELAAASTTQLAQAAVGEGQSVSFAEAGLTTDRLVSMRRGEIVQLTVLPNGNHGADSTLVEFSLTRADGTAAWSVQSLIQKLAEHGPALNDRGATWCLAEVTDGPVLLREPKRQIQGQPTLNGWSLGDTPSVFSTSGTEPLSLWTTLPPQTFFVHPGPGRPVAVMWVCPQDGDYSIHGRVADAHPAGLDGVSFRVDHIASSAAGTALQSLATLTVETLVEPQAPAIPVAYAVIDSAAVNARLQQRGDPELPGDEIPRRWLTVFGGDELSTPNESGRRELADWIVQQPVFARVMANRVWQWHFERGLVATSNDFGFRGERPSHPELLDRLAAEFVRGGYRIKPLHRLLMMTQAWQRSSQASAEQITADPENRLLSHWPRRRLTAEELRDSLLLISGNLDPSSAQSHPFPPEQSWNFTQHNPFNAVYDTNRRSVYLMVQRQRRHPYLALFDGADPNSSTAGRQSTTVPTQALYFLNDPFFHSCADSITRQLTESDATSRVDALFARLYQRKPRDDEREFAIRFTEQYLGSPSEQWNALARVLLSSNEFLYLD